MPGRAEADTENLMQIAYNVKYNAKRMKKLEKEYTVMKTKEQEEMVELRVNKINSCIILYKRQKLKKKKFIYFSG